MLIDELMIALGLKADGVKKGMQEAESTISKGISSITTKLGALGAAFTAALSVGAAWKQYTEEADAMGKLADAIDVDISKLHAWSEASARAGGSAAAFQSSIESLTGQLARQATMGTSRAAKLLEGVGIDAGEIGRQRQAFDVLMDLAEKAETMGKAEFFGLGRSLGLDQGTIMLLQQGRQALKDQIQAQKEFGVYTKEDAKLTADFNDRMADFGQVFRSFASIIFRMVLPPLTKVVELMNKGIAFLRKHEHFVQAFFIGLAAIITTLLIPAFVSLAAAILANPLTWLVVALAAVAAVIEDLVIWAEGGPSAFEGLWEAIFGSPEEAKKTWNNIKQGFSELWEFIKPILAWIKDALIETFKAVAPYVVEFVKDTKADLEKLKNVFSSLAGHIKSVLGAAFNWIIDAWNSVASVLGMTKITVKADISANAADIAHGGAGGGFTPNATNDASMANMVNYTPMDTSGFAEPEAQGGVFDSPFLALVAEDGPEAIVPLGEDKRGRAMDILGAIAPIFAAEEKEPPKQQGRSLDDIASLVMPQERDDGALLRQIGNILPTNTERIETERIMSETIMQTDKEPGIIERIGALFADRQPASVEVNVPKQEPANVEVNVPKQDAVDVNVSKQEAAPVEVNLPDPKVQPAPMIDIEIPKADNAGLLDEMAAIIAGIQPQPAPDVDVTIPKQDDNKGFFEKFAAMFDREPPVPTVDVEGTEIVAPSPDMPDVILPKQEQPKDNLFGRLSSMLGDFVGKAGEAFDDIGGKNIPYVIDTSGLVVAADALPAGGNVSNVTNSNSSETKIGAVNVYTQADDAQGIADTIPRALERSMAGFTAMQADVAYY